MTFSLYNRFRQLEKVRVDKDALEGYLGATSSDGVLRTNAPLTYTDGGDYVTLDLDDNGDYIFGSVLIQTSDTTDPILTFKTLNTAHEVKVYVDEDATNDNLIIEGKTASVDTQLVLRALDGERARFLLYSGTANYGFLQMGSADDLTLKNTVQDMDLIFGIDDGGVDKTITWDADVDKLKHSAGTFDFDDDDIVTSGTLQINSAGDDKNIKIYHNDINARIDINLGYLDIFSPSNVRMYPSGITSAPFEMFAAASYRGFAVTGQWQFRGNSIMDQVLFGTDDAMGNQLILTNYDNRGRDHDHVTQTDPTFYVHSDTDPNTSNVQWLSLTHDKTNAVFGLGTGAYTFPDGAAYFGDGGTTNYASFATDGELNLFGTARVKSQIPIDNANLGKGSTAPSQVILGNYNGWEYTINDDTVFTFHLPHDWASGTDVVINMDWYIDEAGGDEIKWRIDWSATPHDASEAIDAPTHTGNSDTGDIVIPATVKYLTANGLTISSGSLSAGDQIGVKVSRIAITDGTNPGNDPTIVDIHIEYTADKLGEATT